MQQDIKKQSIVEPHIIEMSDRAKMKITGVLDVVSFSEDKIDLKTNKGRILIKGKDLNINKLNTDSGDLNVTGKIDIIEYTDKKDKENIFAGLFR